MSKHNNNNYNTIQPADDVEKEVNGAQEKKDYSDIDSSVIIDKKEEPKKEEAPFVQEEKPVTVSKPALDLYKVKEEKPVKKNFQKRRNKPFNILNCNIDFDKLKDSKDPVDMSLRADYLRLKYAEEQKKK